MFSSAPHPLITPKPRHRHEVRVYNRPAEYETNIPWPKNTVTIGDYIVFNNTSVFWPTWTDYLYGPTTGPSADPVSCIAKHIEFTERFSELNKVFTKLVWSETVLHTWTGAGNCDVRTTMENCYERAAVHTGGWTTLCDGYSRAIGPLEAVTYPLPGMCVTYSSTATVGHRTEYLPGPWPSMCRFSGTVCTGPSSTYLSLSSASRSAVLAGATNIPRSALSIPSWDCEICANGGTDCSLYSEFFHITPKTTSTKTSTARSSANITATRNSRMNKVARQASSNCDKCELVADGGVKVYYWPVTLANSLCLTNTTTITPSATIAGEPNTAVVEGMTLTSPSIYISLATLREAGGKCGDSRKEDVVAVNPEAVSSLRYRGSHPVWAPNPSRGYPYAFNFADLNRHGDKNSNSSFPLVPMDVYNAAKETNCCSLWQIGTFCVRIVDDYEPLLILPSALKELDPLWSNCSIRDVPPNVRYIPIHPKDEDDYKNDKQRVSETTFVTLAPSHTVKATPCSTVATETPAFTLAATSLPMDHP